ncbi:MAG TPA: SDR family oxidoreductase [Polyangiaceae bacterium]|nr:SDR family oxidoreductase [Polyangiaceae bacterium]
MVDRRDLETCLRVLAELRAAGDKHPDHAVIEREVAAFYKGGKKRRRVAREQARSARDRARLEATARVMQTLSPEAASEPRSTRDPESNEEYERARSCYVCKQPYRRVDTHYHMLCPVCANRHKTERARRADLTGRRALVTGGRIKIGFELTRMLLRDGAAVTLITRFPQDAVRRFQALPEAATFGERLAIVGLDLRYLPAVVEFCSAWLARGEALDILVNNAAQTVRRPPAYYRELAAGERALISGRETASPSADSRWLEAHNSGRGLLDHFHEQCLQDRDCDAFPIGLRTEEGLPLDLRERNSWRLALADVDTREMVEAQLVNAMAPFVLMGKLRPALERSAFSPRFIVNVSAMEGKFDYRAKTSRHPHTNMAKAALNMLTRTSAADYAESEIYVNSVDTGWITDENPEPLKLRLRENGFHPPLDVVDGAARIYAPILDGLAGKPYFGQFLKDFSPTTW